MVTIAMMNKKGGVGKTTTALAVAAYLGRSGKRVLAIDMDAQANFTQSSRGERGVEGAFDFLKGEKFEDVVQKASAYDFIGADKRLSQAEAEFRDVIGKEHLLEKALKTVRGYDYCVIDTPPSMEVLTLNALTAADRIVVCCQSDSYSVAGLAEMRKNIEAVREFLNPRIKVAGILLTRYNARTAVARQLSSFFADAAEAMDAKVFETAIRENTALKEAAVQRQNIFEYRGDSHGAEDYAAFTRELIGE